jgi:hypothetical protein
LPWQLEQPLKSASSEELPVAAMPTHYRGCGRSSFCREFSSSNALETRINIGASVSPLDKMDYFVERLPGPARGREFTTCDDPGTT